LVLEELDRLVLLVELMEATLFSVPLLRLAAGKAAITTQIKQTEDLAAVLEKERQLQQEPQGKELPGVLLMIRAELLVLEAAAAQAQRGVMALSQAEGRVETDRLVQ